ncbi:MAG: M20 family peptidase [Brevefilum sp.]|jgi:carboxypeptidase PM20D1
MNINTLLIALVLGLAALALFLLGFLLLKTALFSPPQKEIKPRRFVGVDGKSVAERLGLAVQFKTISHDDPERIDSTAFFGLHRLLKTLYPEVHSRLKTETVNDYSLLYTWEGKDPELKPIMLISHLDVVPADEADWTHPPFSGEIVDGYVWGRGTMDDKLGVIGTLEAVDYLLKRGFQPERTVYLGFGHDEELGGENGAAAISALLASRGVRLGSVLDEGGTIMNNFLPNVETPVGVVGISEKGYLSLRLIVELAGGHSSMPPEETTIGILSRAIHRLENHPMPARLEVIEFLMSYLGSALPFFQRMLFANTWLFGGILKKKLRKSKTLNAVIRTTTAPTIISAGEKDNVLPGRAEAVVNFRLLPGDDLRTVYERVLAIIDDPRVKVVPFIGDTLGESGWDPSPVADVESPYYQKLARLIKEAYPECLVTPYLVLGGTDARRYIPLTTNTLRFMPVQFEQDDLQRMHGIDERLSIENCGKMVSFYIAYIEELSSAFDDEIEMDIEEVVHDEDDDDLPIPTLEETMALQHDDDFDIPDMPEGED